MMLIRIVMAMVLLTTFFSAEAQTGTNGASAINVMPLPASVKLTPGKLKLDTNFIVVTDGYSDARLERAIVRLQHRLRRRTGVVLPLGVATSGTSAALTV